MTDERLSDDELSEIAIRYKHDGRGTVLGYRAKQEILSLRTALAASEAKVQAAWNDALEEAAKGCEQHVWMADIEWWMKATKKEVSSKSALECAAAIRALKVKP